jgi:branched-subunit amino acid aminotransferase/4-amino-4-deoxychorismate lyase
MSTPPPEFAPWLGVFETLRVVDGKPLFLDWHRAELASALAELDLVSDADFAAEAVKLPSKSGRWRWIVTRQGTQILFGEEAPMKPESTWLGVSPVRVGSYNWDARFKTVSHLSHMQAAQVAEGGEAVLLNEAGEVACASRANIFWMRGRKLYTPAHEAGCRCGVVRRFIMENYPVNQGRFMLNELLAADEIFLTNSLRGIVSVTLVQGKEVSSSDVADKLRVLYNAEIARQLG